MRDRDRILYSSAFRRLSGVTQVASPTELAPVHNRLSHSLKVAQVGRALGMSLLRQAAADPSIDDALNQIGGLDLDVIEAACLAHDLGHPPFGHVAEETLDDLLVRGGHASGVADGYNGNAQTFRIVTKLAVRDNDLSGLDLTRATLNAILKYPWAREAHGKRHEKWGAYISELDDFRWCREHAHPANDGGQVLEAALMDWADDITYAVHDVEDFFRAGLIPIDRLSKDTQEQKRFFDWVVSSKKVNPSEIDRLEEAFQRTEFIDPGAPPGPYRGLRSDRAWLRSMTSELIGRLVQESVALRIGDSGLELVIQSDMVDEVRVLKLLAWCYVIESPSLVTQRFGQRALIRSLFKTYVEAAGSPGDTTIFPSLYQDALEVAQGDIKLIKRIVADLISSMSEAQVVAIHQRLTGQSLGSAMDAYLQ
jgi:dGTPase